MKYMILALGLVCFSCTKQNFRENEKEISATPAGSNLAPSPCTLVYDLTLNSNGSYSCYYGGVDLTLNSLYYQMLCDNGLVLATKGAPAWTHAPIIPAAGTGASVEQLADMPGEGTRFAIALPYTNASVPSAFHEGVEAYNQAFMNYLTDTTHTISIPDLQSYLPGTSMGVNIITGKLIRTLTGSNFAIVTLCYVTKQPTCLDNM